MDQVSRTVKGNLTMVKSLGRLERNALGLETWIPPMGPYTIIDKVRMSLACTTLIFSLRKEIHAEHLQWYFMRKAPTV